MTGARFDYEDTRSIEGRGEVRVGTHDLAALRLERVLEGIPDGQVRVLEVGCGAGRHTRAIKHYRPESRVNGCDLSERAIEEAKAAGGEIDYRIGDALNLPYGEGDFDIVVILDVLEHVENPEQAIAEVRRVLAPGGMLLLYVPLEANKGTLYNLLRRSSTLPILDWKRELVGHIQHFTAGEVASLLSRGGFRIRETSYSFHLAGQIHDVVDYWSRNELRQSFNPVRRLLTRLVSKPIFIVMWRLAYYEDMLRRNDPVAAGIHIMAIR